MLANWRTGPFPGRPEVEPVLVKVQDSTGIDVVQPDGERAAGFLQCVCVPGCWLWDCALEGEEELIVQPVAESRCRNTAGLSVNKREDMVVVLREEVVLEFF